MRYTGSSHTIRGLFALILTTAAMLVGCAGAASEMTPAKSAFVFWDSDSVWLVADGQLPEQLAGYRCYTASPSGRPEARELRLSSPMKALAVLGKWRGDHTLRFAVVPMTVDDLSEEKLGPECSVLLEQMSTLAASLARETNGDYVVIATSASKAPQIRGDLTQRGLTDDTMQLPSRMSGRLKALSAFFGNGPDGQ